MNRGILIGILAFVLIGFLVAEQIYVDNTIGALKHKCEVLEAAIISQNESESKTSIEDIEKFWKGHEMILTSIIDYNDIKEIGKQINLVKSAIEADDFETALTECNLLIYHANSGSLIFNFDFQNIL